MEENNKQENKKKRMFAIFAVALMLAVAVVGAGIAYQAIYQNKDNESTAHYIQIKTAQAFTFDAKYDTKTVRESGDETNTTDSRRSSPPMISPSA